MKKMFPVLLSVLLFVAPGFAQVTVTNPSNTTPNLAAGYSSLADALSALNTITAISGPVTITLAAGNPQTAPAGGYIIQFAAVTSSAKTVTISGNNNVITSFTPQTTGSLNDAIFKLIGADFITLRDFTLQENPLNTTTGGAAPGDATTGNNMTEWGIALLHASPINGAQNNTIQNNLISLTRTYTNSFGIYANNRHSATVINIAEDISNNIDGPNSYNKLYSNSISNVNMGISFIGSAIPANMDVGNDIGGNLAATGNTITDWGGAPAASGFISNSPTSYGIFINHQLADNISYNTLISAPVSGTPTSFTAIRKDYTVAAPAGTFTTTIAYNTVTMSSAFTSGFFRPISSAGMGTLSTATININNNNIFNCTMNGVSSTSNFVGIFNSSAPGLLNITNNKIRGYTSNATGGNFTAINNSGQVTNSINISNNEIGDLTAGAATFTMPTSGSFYCIHNSAAAPTATVNLNNNSIDGISVITTGQVTFVYNISASNVAVNMNNNLFGTKTGSLISYSGTQAGNNMFGVFTQNTGVNCAVAIEGNQFQGINFGNTTGMNITLIGSQTAAFSVHILNNSFVNLNLKTTGNVTLIYRHGSMSATGSSNCNNNRVVGAFNKSAAGGQLIFFYSAAGSVNGATMTETGNDFSNITATGATTVYGWYNLEGASAGTNGPTKNISNNIFSNITGGSNLMRILWTDYGAATTCNNNTISNISGTADVTAIHIGQFNGQSTHQYSGNSITNVSATGTGGDVKGIAGGATAIGTLNIDNNTITRLSSTGATSFINGIELNAGAMVNINNNLINEFTGTGTTSPTANGIAINAGTTVNVHANNINNLQENGTGNVYVHGLLLAGGTAVNTYNNFISDLKAPNSNFTDAVSGISITSSTAPSNYNLYFNSVNINAGSTGANFGSAGLYHQANATASTASLQLVNNIIVNTSVANGAGYTIAYKRSGTALNNYATGSDHNLFYAGTPGPKNLIFYDGTNEDQTLLAYQSRVAPADVNDLSLLPNFTTATDLHLAATNNCVIKGSGMPIPGYTLDIDGQFRDGSTPDIGADEFNAVYNTTLAGIAATAVCQSKPVAVLGTTYSDNSCHAIAKLTPGGGSAVYGVVNVCVTLDAVPIEFNGEPYVQRHHDLEPANDPATATGTVTLYYTDAEFITYNTNNPVYPPLPTNGAGNTVANRNNVRITQFHGTPTGGLPTTSPGSYTGTRVLITPGAANVLWNGNYWEVSFPVTGFSGFYLHTTLSNAPLPITLNYFTGVKQGGNHLLNWKVTCNSTPRATMILERSGDGRNFTELNSTTADAVRCAQPFNYTDGNPLPGLNYYRLRMIDADGKITYSSQIALMNAVKGFEIISIAPNPVVSDNFRLNVTSARSSTMEVSIIDMQGRLVNRQRLSMVSGFNSLPVNVGKLASGTYTLQASSGDDQSKNIRFVKQ